MPKYIDIEKLQFEPDPWGGMNGVLFVGRSAGKTIALVKAALKRMIQNAPTVDAIPVKELERILSTTPGLELWDYQKRGIMSAANRLCGERSRE